MDDVHAPQAMDWAAIKIWRRARRAALLQARLGAPREARSGWSADVESRAKGLLARMPAGTLGFYLPFKGEFDARKLVRALLGAGWSAALPAVVDKERPLEFRAWRPGIEMVPGVYEIPVPKARDVVRPDVLLVPVVGFDAANYRLGYGGGYYDMTLAAARPRPRTIGVGYELSRLETIYPQAHDIPLDTIVTESGMQER